jgi:UDP-N-acetylglucosamine acyltransferase
MARVHPSAAVDPAARLAADVEVGPFSVIGPAVTIGAGTTVGSHVVIDGRTTLGARNRVFPFASIGLIAQDRKYAGEPVTTTIGDDNVFREYVSVHAGTAQDRSDTRIGNGNWFLAHTHVAHDCVVGDQNVFANAAMLAGHVHVDHHAFLSGHTAIHQFARIGAYVMVSGLTGVSQDVPPFVTVDGHRADIVGLNVVGLRRAGFDQAARRRIKAAYQLLYRAGLSREAALARLRAEPQTPEIVEILRFFDAGGRRGVTGWRRIAAGGAEEGD